MNADLDDQHHAATDQLDGGQQRQDNRLRPGRLVLHIGLLLAETWAWALVLGGVVFGPMLLLTLQMDCVGDGCASKVAGVSEGFASDARTIFLVGVGCGVLWGLVRLWRLAHWLPPTESYRFGSVIGLGMAVITLIVMWLAFSEAWNAAGLVSPYA